MKKKRKKGFQNAYLIILFHLMGKEQSVHCAVICFWEEFGKYSHRLCSDFSVRRLFFLLGTPRD